MELRKTSATSAKPLQPKTAPATTGSSPAPNPQGPSVASPSDEFVLSSQPLGELSSPDRNLVEPEVGQQYQANRSLPRPITLSFDDKAVAFFHNGHLKIDLEEAKVVTEDGKRFPLDHRVSSQQSPRDRYAVSSGYQLPPNAEPWQFRVPGIPSQVFGKPPGIRVVGEDQGITIKYVDSTGNLIDQSTAMTELDDFQGMRVDTPVLRRNRHSTLGKLASHTPSESQPGPASLPFTNSSIPNVTLRSPSQAGLDTATKAFETLLGPIARERAESVDFEKLRVYEQHVGNVINKELESGGDVDGFAAMQKALDSPEALAAMQDIYGFGATALADYELLDGVTQKTLRACPLEIIVIPRNKTALDCVEEDTDSIRERLSQAGRAYFLKTHPLIHRVQTGSDELPSQKLFVGEEILEKEQGVKAVLMHEMLHVFEQIYATPEETQQIDASFQQATEFQSLYGSNRDEYLTTIGEEFLGTHGPEGPEWVKEKHGPVYQLLSKLTRGEGSVQQP